MSGLLRRQRGDVPQVAYRWAQADQGTAREFLPDLIDVVGIEILNPIQ